MVIVTVVPPGGRRQRHRAVGDHADVRELHPVLEVIRGVDAEIVILPSPWLLLVHWLQAPTSVVAGE
jgi:hypothetical protein